MVIDPSAEVACFINVSLRATFATNEIDAVICAARCVTKYFVGAICDGAFKTVRVGVLRAHH